MCACDAGYVCTVCAELKYRSTSKPHKTIAVLDELVAENERLAEIADSAQAFIATTSVFRQPKVSRDSFEAMALLVLARRMKLAGAAVGGAPKEKT